MSGDFVFRFSLLLSASFSFVLGYHVEQQRNFASMRTAIEESREAFSAPRDVFFRGEGFSTRIPDGWVVSFPKAETKFNIGRLLENGSEYEALIRLDSGRPVEDLKATVAAMVKRFQMKVVDDEVDWAGQTATILSGDPQGILRPQRVLVTIKNEKLYMLFGAHTKDCQMEQEWDYVVKHWEWDE